MAITTGWSIKQKSFPKKENIEEKIKFLLRYAILAPSIYNTQPWKFKIKKNKLIIKVDKTKKLKVIDPKSREIWISIGALIENFSLAAQKFGFKTTKENKKNQINIILKKDKKVSNPLFKYITKRRTNRLKPRRMKIGKKNIEKMKKIDFERGTNVYFFNKKEDILNFLDIIKKANKKKYSNEKYVEDILNWTKFNKKEYEKTKEGISYNEMAMPQTGKQIGKKILKMFLKPDSINIEDQKKLLSSSGIILITSTQDNRENWIKTGITLQRTLLKLTSLKISYSFINIACRTNKTRKILKNLTDEEPQIILRIGYSKKTPHSLRKELKEKIIES